MQKFLLFLSFTMFVLTACSNGLENDPVSPEDSPLGLGTENVSSSSVADDVLSSSGVSENKESYVPYVGEKPNWKYLNPSIAYDEIVDERDGQRYKTVVIGDQTWFAENLNLATIGGNADDQVASKCAKDSCEVYGRLYTWAAAMNFDASYNNLFFYEDKVVPHQGICPNGWHVPEKDEFVVLLNNFDKGIWFEANMKLKSMNAWVAEAPATDDVGFSAIPVYEESYSNNGIINEYQSRFWTTLDKDSKFGERAKYAIILYIVNEELFDAGYADGNKEKYMSIRCIKD